MSLRVFDGGCPLDIGVVHDVSPSEVVFSTWRVENVIHLSKSMKINFPVSCEEQRRVENSFKNISPAEYDNFVGCIDGFLIWTFKPNEKGTIVSEVGVKNFTASERENLVETCKGNAIQNVDDLT